jgi:hypothetical protein
MIRAKQIRLVLVTALLASCNRVIIPDNAADDRVPDSTLTLRPVYDETMYDCNCVFNPYYQPYSFDLGFYYTGQPYGTTYTPGRNYRKFVAWQNNKHILRGGFSKSAASTGS